MGKIMVLWDALGMEDRKLCFFVLFRKKGNHCKCFYFIAIESQMRALTFTVVNLHAQ